MAHIKKIDEMNSYNGAGKTLGKSDRDMLSDFFRWMSNAINCTDTEGEFPNICFVSTKIVNEITPAALNCFGYVADENVLENIVKTADNEKPWLWDTEKSYFSLSDRAISCLKRAAICGCYFLIVVKDVRAYMDLLEEMGDHANAISARSIKVL